MPSLPCCQERERVGKWKLSTSLCEFEDRLLCNDLIMITYYGDDHGSLGIRLGDGQGHHGHSSQDEGHDYNKSGSSLVLNNDECTC